MKRWSTFLAGGFLSGLLLTMILAPIFGLEAGLEQNADRMLESAGWQHPFGTDSLGRDLFARVIAGGRVSLLVGIVCASLSLIFGGLYGAIAGWNEGWIDRLLMRLCDILMALPSFILVSVIVLTLNLTLPMDDLYAKSLVSLIIGIFSTHWMGLARVSRGMVLEIRRKPFIEAATVLGGSPRHIIWKHIFPHTIGTLFVVTAMQVPSNIVYESFMSFIGLGVQPPYTSWGILVRDGWKTLSSFPHLILFPTFILFMTVWSLHILLDHFKKARRL